MLAGSEALVKPSELMSSLGPVPPGDGGSAEQGQGGLESRMGSSSRGFWMSLARQGDNGTAPCSGPWMGRRSRPGWTKEALRPHCRSQPGRGQQEGIEWPGVGNRTPRVGVRGSNPSCMAWDSDSPSGASPGSSIIWS